MPRLTQTVVGLSYANRRRVEISRALASRPRLLLLDEPTAGMNTSESLELAEQIKGLHALGLTILVLGVRLIQRGVTKKFTDDLSGGTSRSVIRLGQAGYIVKGEFVQSEFLARVRQLVRLP